MSNQSNRHHYIPKFYLSNFTNSSNELAIYDCETRRIKDKLFSPKTHFFEQKRNSFEINGVIRDDLEKVYSHFDNKNAKFIQRIGIENYQLTIEDIFRLQLFISNTFWRIPINDNQIREIIKQSSIKELGLIFTNRDGEEVQSEFISRLMNHPFFIESMRCFIPMHRFPIDNRNINPNEWVIYSSDEAGFHFCCDNPIIRNSKKDIIDFSEDFIFRLSKTHILVKCKANTFPKELSSEFLKLLDIFLLLQSQKFVGSASKEYLTHISTIAHNFIGKEEGVKEIIFNYSHYLNTIRI